MKQKEMGRCAEVRPTLISLKNIAAFTVLAEIKPLHFFLLLNS